VPRPLLAESVHPVVIGGGLIGWRSRRRIVVDHRLRISDDRVSAIGDCASFPIFAGRHSDWNRCRTPGTRPAPLDGLLGAGGGYRAVPVLVPPVRPEAPVRRARPCLGRVRGGGRVSGGPSRVPVAGDELVRWSRWTARRTTSRPVACSPARAAGRPGRVKRPEFVARPGRPDTDALP